MTNDDLRKEQAFLDSAFDIARARFAVLAHVGGDGRDTPLAVKSGRGREPRYGLRGSITIR